MAAATAQELSKSWNLLNAIAEQKAFNTLFSYCIKEWITSLILKLEIYHLFNLF